MIGGEVAEGEKRLEQSPRNTTVAKVKSAPPRRSSREHKPTDPFYLSPQWRALRLFILRRDSHRCVICKCDVSGKGKARVDHIKPRKTHPHLELNPANMRTLCTVHDAQGHRERASGGTQRIERMVLRGCDVEGWPA